MDNTHIRENNERRINVHRNNHNSLLLEEEWAKEPTRLTTYERNFNESKQIRQTNNGRCMYHRCVNSHRQRCNCEIEKSHMFHSISVPMEYRKKDQVHVIWYICENAKKYKRPIHIQTLPGFERVHDDYYSSCDTTEKINFCVRLFSPRFDCM